MVYSHFYSLKPVKNFLKSAALKTFERNHGCWGKRFVQNLRDLFTKKHRAFYLTYLYVRASFKDVKNHLVTYKASRQEYLVGLFKRLETNDCLYG